MSSSFPHSFISRLTLRQVLEWEDAVTRATTDTRFFLNTFNTAAQLPSDILVIIPLFLPSARDTFAMSQVCHRWRTAAISSASLWTRIDCQSLARTIASLERHRSVPLRLELRRGFSNEALNAVLDHESKLASLSVYPRRLHLGLICRCLLTTSVEELALFIDKGGPPERNTLSIRCSRFRSLRRLLVSAFSVSIDNIGAPNLTHLALEVTAFTPGYTAHSVLEILLGCPQLETVPVNSLVNPTRIQQSYTPVTLPNLRSIELGYGEIRAGLIIPLRFPQVVAVAFRNVMLIVDLLIQESIRQVLAVIDIQSVTLARISDRPEDGRFFAIEQSHLVRYECPKGSLEITTPTEVAPIEHTELLLSHSPKLGNVRTLRIMDLRTYHEGTLITIVSTMNNLVSINFLGRNLFVGRLFPKDGLTVLPHLKHISGLRLESSLVKLARARKAKGVPLSTLDVDGRPEDGDRAYFRELRKFVEVVKVWRCSGLPERWTDNLVLDSWEGAGYDGPVSVYRCRESAALSSFIEIT